MCADTGARIPVGASGILQISFSWVKISLHANFCLLSHLELKLDLLTLFWVKVGRGSGDPIFSSSSDCFSWVKISLHF